MHNERIYYPGKENVYLDCYVLNSGLKLGQEIVAVCDIDYEKAKREVIAAYEKKLPDKSTFEK